MMLLKLHTKLGLFLVKIYETFDRDRIEMCYYCTGADEAFFESGGRTRILISAH